MFTLSTPTRPAKSADRTRRFGASSAATGVALVCLGLVSAATPAVSSSPGDGTTAARAGRVTTEFRFNFDNGESLEPGTRVRDASRHKNRGTVVVSGNGNLKRVDGLRGIGAKYPRKCRGCGRALIEVSDERTLRPRRHPFWFGAAVRATDGQARRGKDPNIVQKGYIYSQGGQWKLELVGSRPRCVIAGRRGEVKVKSSVNVDDGTWHNLQCRREGRLVTLRVDGKVVNRGKGRIGRITTTAPIRIGGKGVGSRSGDDQYHGSLDNVYLRIDRR